MKAATFRDLANRQHGPSTAVPFTRADATSILFAWRRRHGQPLRCPDCGAALDVDADALKGLPGDADATVQVRVAACSGCEFVKEF